MPSVPTSHPPPPPTTATTTTTTTTTAAAATAAEGMCKYRQNQRHCPTGTAPGVPVPAGTGAGPGGAKKVAVTVREMGQPRANKEPQGQLAALLRGRLDEVGYYSTPVGSGSSEGMNVNVNVNAGGAVVDAGSGVHGFAHTSMNTMTTPTPTPMTTMTTGGGSSTLPTLHDILHIHRPSSAPPTQVLQNSMEDETSPPPAPGDYRADPEYHVYYHANSRLDPRLPPPVYCPGMSGLRWGKGAVGWGRERERDGVVGLGGWHGKDPNAVPAAVPPPTCVATSPVPPLPPATPNYLHASPTLTPPAPTQPFAPTPPPPPPPPPLAPLSSSSSTSSSSLPTPAQSGSALLTMNEMQANASQLGPGSSGQQYGKVGVNERAVLQQLALQQQQQQHHHHHQHHHHPALFNPAQVASATPPTPTPTPPPAPSMSSSASPPSPPHPTNNTNTMMRKKNLVDMIQEDFPKTPSQMYNGAFRSLVNGGRMGEEEHHTLNNGGAAAAAAAANGVHMSNTNANPNANSARSLHAVFPTIVASAAAAARSSKDDSKLAFTRARLSPPPRASSTPPSQFFRADHRSRASCSALSSPSTATSAISGMSSLSAVPASASSLRHTISAGDLGEHDTGEGHGQQGSELLRRLREMDLNDEFVYSQVRRLRDDPYLGRDMPEVVDRSHNGGTTASAGTGFLHGVRGYETWDVPVAGRQVQAQIQQPGSLAGMGTVNAAAGPHVPHSMPAHQFGYKGNDVLAAALDRRVAAMYALRDDAQYLAGVRAGRASAAAAADPYGKVRKYATVSSPMRNPGGRSKIHVDSVLDLSTEPRHPILEEFRASKKRFELADILGHVVLFAGDQHGSRFIQQKLETATPEEKQLIFDEIRPTSLQLMNDVFGNYVIQKFFEHGTPSQRLMLGEKMRGHIYQLSLQMYGCRVVQKALEHVGPELQVSMIRELEGHVMKCVKDQNGNHVIQKAIERVPERQVQFVIEAFHGQVFQLATHPYGCRVIQRMFEHCTDDQVQPLMAEMHKHTVHLIQDQYGNYVIQHILERGKPSDKSMVVGKVRGQVLTLSKHKFASNVIEKCVQFGTKEDRQNLIDEVLETRSDGSCPLTLMMRDQFANYVVQKMLDCVEPEQRDLLIARIRPQLPALRKVAYGKHLIAKVEKYMAAAAASAMAMGIPGGSGVPESATSSTSTTVVGH